MVDETKNFMILNNKNIGIKKVELNKDELYIEDKTGVYSLCIHIYNWEKINQIKVGEKQNIDFNEYCLSENNETALIWPTKSFIRKPTKDSIIFSLEFNDFSDICYMNKRDCFNIKLNSLYVQVYINYNDVKEKSIIYNFEN